MSPLLSIVVPFYNVEAYLEACLESVAQQTLSDLEVVMIDDGSTDASATIAKEFETRDSRFRLVRQENQGLGLARNAGLPHTSGRYLAFIDSDDIIPRYAFDLMVGSLEETGSDIACGAVRRIGINGLQRSAMHDRIFPIDRKATHVRDFPELLCDRTAWNKVFRRAFWDKHDFTFPAGLYEDIPVTIPAHVLASKVDVLREVVYHWRIRETGTRSITQRRTEPGNLADRIRSVRAASSFLAKNAPDLKDAYDRSALADDIRIYVNVVDQGDDAYRESFLALVNEFLDEIDLKLLNDLTAIDRLKFHAVRERLMDELIDIVSFAKSNPMRHSAIQRQGGGDTWYGDYPYLGDPRFPDHLYALSDELKLQTGVDEIMWHNGKLRIEGHAYIDRMDAPGPGDSTIELEFRKRRVVLVPKILRPKPERIRRPDVTAQSGQATACHDWSGFAVEIDPAQLGSNEGTWHIFVTVTTHGIKRRGRLTTPRGAGLWPPDREVAPGMLIKPKYTPAKELIVGVQPVRALVTDVKVDGERLLLSGRVRQADAAFVRKGAITAAYRQGTTTVSWPMTATNDAPSGHLGFTAVADLRQLAEGLGSGNAAAAGAAVTDSIEWDFSLTAGGQDRLRLAVEADLLDLRADVAGREYDVIATNYGNLTLVERAPRPTITHVEWLDGTTIRVAGTSGDEGTRPDRLIMRRRRTSDVHEVPLSWDGPAFTALLNARRESGFPLPTGRWDLYVPGAHGEINMGIDRATRRALPEPRFVGVHELSLQSHRGDLLHLWIRTALSDDERGAYAQRRLQRHYYSSANTAPLRDLVVFESYFGRQYSCNPRAVFEEMQRREPGLEYVWFTAEGQFDVPEGARTVLRGTREYYELSASARIVVNNCLQMQGYGKRPGQVYLQTWHGTPYKHIGYDLVKNGRIASNTTKLSRYEEDVPLWDHLISPSAHVTGMLRQAFRYEGDVLEVGYPRNDLLFAPDREERARRVRERLGVPPGRRVALYVPTWREDIWLTRGRQAELVLDTARLAAAVGDDYTILVRQHHMVADRTAGIGGDVIDVTRHPDITELYLIADVVITDYSSVMFDFAATGRPILFFTPDLEFYQEELRGTYFDLTAEAPGPLLREVDEVAGALRDLDGVTSTHLRAYTAFQNRYCAMDVGQAAARIADRLLG
ncbi:CDP-glycerol glycerophosphotransferase family protein [Actinomadura sp. NAK00032]|uniref:bifunctional glycosyltransferase/CDP-glycerol:glycerophosphate glycerophosphotransferase n=1 Tax=Actinomadura sp. NAK00032 TaxID=2742128 RepID=UPI001590D1C5|nr:bifunctional glycosyltransferase/CDP-glycerol:glycerophosphate glycerophosphotransferase [Actinomadura sp. NAK00032]QKW39035.1 CDP-glycerol glycerophosphotransferase family protein [Actinomadura sp. NAK00032]